MSDVVQNRYEFVLFFDVENGNPNGDPDAGNMPRIDPETGFGIVTDVCLKRKIRNYVNIVKEGVNGYDIYVQEGGVLNLQHKKAYDYLEIKPEAKKMPKDKEQARKITEFMCFNFFDIRAFGAVMTTEVNGGQVQGPVQLAFSRSIDPIIPQEITITRMAVTNERDLEKERAMGRKHIIPYGLYKVEGFVSSYLAKKACFTEDDLELLWEALINMFDHDHSAARGKMSSRKLYIFKHESALGNAPAYQLFDLVKVAKKDENRPARSFYDYQVNIERDNIPAGVTIIEK